MSNLNKYLPIMDLTANEVSNLWSSYMMNSMVQRFCEYFITSTEDSMIKQMIDKMLNQTQLNMSELKEIFDKENLTVPLAFTAQDVRVDTYKVFSDTFILFIYFDLTHLTMSTYPSALSDSSRDDVRNHFQENIAFIMKFQNEIIDLMLTRGIYLKPPQVAIDTEVEFANNMMYLNGFFGGSRALNVAEIANLSRIIHRAQFSKMVFVTFSKFAQTKELKKHFGKGRDGIENVLDSLQEILKNENIPISSSADYQISEVEMPPFSDKLMLFFVNTCLGIFCFTMINQAMTSSLRTDIVYKLGKISDDMKKYYEQGLLFAIKEKWFEQPPQSIDRKV